ncbi:MULTISPECIES: hypothetical protein [unclassified Streptomyces]|uniref:hypothetical protein n=1 Tax=Streptomyces sp. SID8359 TaxID=2690343 RepID=UPI0018E333D8|nr:MULTISPECIES: hypothetical protein [unclassified Streptomyces]
MAHGLWVLFRLAVVVLLGSGDLGVVGEDASEQVVTGASGVAECPVLCGFLLGVGSGFGFAVGSDAERLVGDATFGRVTDGVNDVPVYSAGAH